MGTTYFFDLGVGTVLGELTNKVCDAIGSDSMLAHIRSAISMNLVFLNQLKPVLVGVFCTVDAQPVRLGRPIRG